MTNLDIGGVLERLRETLARLEQSPKPVGQRKHETDAFLYNIFDLGRALNLKAEARESPDVREFLNASATILPEFTGEFELYMGATEDRLIGAWEGGEWELVCRRRSSLEFLVELYRNTDYEEYLHRFGCADLDERLRQRGLEEGYLDPSRIPEGIPRSHWWYWYPE
jgi:hypothetical protein